MPSVSIEQLFANTITSNASVQAHLEVILRNQAELLAKQTGEDEETLLNAFRFDVNNRTKEIKREMLDRLTKEEK